MPTPVPTVLARPATPAQAARHALLGSAVMIPFRVYTIAGVVRGRAPGVGTIRDRLESQPIVEIREASFAPLERLGEPHEHEDVHLDPDDVLIALDADDGVHPHAQWHAIRLLAGPWIVDGDLATMPGFDPGRALTRPSGSFVQLRNARVSRASDGQPVGEHEAILVHRYAVERVDADLELGFYFPGASVVEAAGVGSWGVAS